MSTRKRTKRTEGSDDGVDETYLQKRQRNNEAVTRFVI